MASGKLSQGVKFGYKTSSSGSTYTEFPGLYEIPQIGSAPEKIDVTALSSQTKVYINGLQDPGDMEFSFWYIPGTPTSGATPTAGDSNFKEIRTAIENATDNVLYFEIEFPDKQTNSGHGTKCTFYGQTSVFMDSTSVNSAMTFKLSVAPQEDSSTHKTFTWTDAT